MKWNYRVARIVPHDCYDMIEVYYADDGSISGYVKANVSGWEHIADMKGTLQMMLEACDKPLVQIDGDNIKEC